MLSFIFVISFSFFIKLLMICLHFVRYMIMDVIELRNNKWRPKLTIANGSHNHITSHWMQCNTGGSDSIERWYSNWFSDYYFFYFTSYSLRKFCFYYLTSKSKKNYKNYLNVQIRNGVIHNLIQICIISSVCSINSYS